MVAALPVSPDRCSHHHAHSTGPSPHGSQYAEELLGKATAKRSPKNRFYPRAAPDTATCDRMFVWTCSHRAQTILKNRLAGVFHHWPFSTAAAISARLDPHHTKLTPHAHALHTAALRRTWWNGFQKIILSGAWSDHLQVPRANIPVSCAAALSGSRNGRAVQQPFANAQLAFF